MNTSADTILCIGLSPALQRLMYFDRIEPGLVNRAREVNTTPGGKACNAARTLACLGRSVVLTGFNGGLTGQALAEQFDAIGIEHDFIDIPLSTRICTTLIETATGRHTELVEEAPWPGTDCVTALYDMLERRLPETAGVLIAGALPPGADPAVYTHIVRRCRARDIPVFVDTPGDGFRAALEAGPLFMKMNRYEREKTAGADEGAFAADVLSRGVQGLLITDGAGDAHLYEPDACTTMTPLPIEEHNNIGSGDATLAGTAHALLNGEFLRDAVIFGMACGTANATNAIPGLIEFDTVQQLHEQLKQQTAI